MTLNRNLSLLLSLSWYCTTAGAETFFQKPENIYIVAGAGGGVVVVVVTVVVVACCCTKRQRKRPQSDKRPSSLVDTEQKHQNNDDAIDENDELVMADNIMYAGYSNGDNVSTKPEHSHIFKIEPDRTVITDVYAKVNKAGKSKSATKVKVNEEKPDSCVEREHNSRKGTHGNNAYINCEILPAQTSETALG